MKLLAAVCLLAKSFDAINVSSNVSELNASSQRAESKGTVSTAEHAKAAVASAPQRAKLDVGFASFEKEITDLVSASFMNVTNAGSWTDSVRNACIKNVTESFSAGLKTQLKPMKAQIGKTWMSFPDDDTRNAYVAQLKSSYASDFKESLETIDTHLKRSFRHLNTFLHSGSKKATSPEQLLSRCETEMAGNLMVERCYDKSGEQTLKPTHSFLQMQKAQNKFCMPSVFEALAHRLHDSEGLIGMTMQFESKSLALSTAPSAINDIVAQAGAMNH
jgi:hypothetical protein